MSNVLALPRKAARRKPACADTEVTEYLKLRRDLLDQLRRVDQRLAEIGRELADARGERLRLTVERLEREYLR